MPGILALAVLSTAFTSLAIGTGFERRYGVLKRLGASPLSRSGLIAGQDADRAHRRGGAVGVVVGDRRAARLVGRRQPGRGGSGPLLLLAGTAAFSGLALLMAGTLRAEATLAAANLVYLMLGLGGVLFPLTKFPAVVQPLQAAAAGALSDGLRSVLAHAGGFPGADLLVLCAWAVAAIGLAARTFRWE